MFLSVVTSSVSRDRSRDDLRRRNKDKYLERRKARRQKPVTDL